MQSARTITFTFILFELFELCPFAVLLENWSKYLHGINIRQTAERILHIYFFSYFPWNVVNAL